MEKNDAHSSTSYSGSVYNLHSEFSLKVDTLLTKTNSFYLGRKQTRVSYSRVSYARVTEFTD